VRGPLPQAFPFPSTGKGDTAPALSGLCVYLQFMWEVGLPPSPVQFSSHCHFHKLSCSCLLGGAAAPAGHHVCLQFMWEVGLPPSSVQFSSHCHFHKLSCSCLLGGAAAPAGHHVCLQFMWEVGLPSSPVEFSSLHHSHKLPRSWLLGARPTPARGSPPTRLVYLQSREGFPSPNLQRSGRPTLFSVCLNCSYCLLLSFSFFARVEVSLSRGLCCSGPGLSVGEPQYRKAHLVCVFPSHIGASHWRPLGPSSFLHLT
jgi:hypothetical protein